MKTMSIEELREIQLRILSEVATYCKRNGIKYFLCGGSLLGAVRHNGYIPWDDDIDIALLRSDYEKLVADFNTDSTLYTLYTSENKEDYPYPFAKISYNNSILVEENDVLPFNIGVNIDIFPIDTVPEEDKLQRDLIKSIMKKRNVLNLKSIVVNKERKCYKNAILKVGKFFYKLKSTKSIVNDIIKLAKMYESQSSNLAGIIVWGYGEREIVSKNIFNDVISMKFEGYEYDVPVGYHDWLTSVYGDYLVLPPLDKQSSHHAFKAYWKE